MAPVECISGNPLESRESQVPGGSLRLGRVPFDPCTYRRKNPPPPGSPPYPAKGCPLPSLSWPDVTTACTDVNSAPKPGGGTLPAGSRSPPCHEPISSQGKFSPGNSAKYDRFNSRRRTPLYSDPDSAFFRIVPSGEQGGEGIEVQRGTIRAYPGSARSRRCPSATTPADG